MARTIAIVEDEWAIAANYADALRRQGYAVALHAQRRAALDAFHTRLPDLVLLDIGLGEEAEGGFELCRELRTAAPTLPIIFLTARDSDLDAISGLRLGADDYLTKDISLPHLCARVAACFRRLDALRAPAEPSAAIERGALRIDPDRFTVHWGEAPVELSLTEFWIVHSLALRPGHVKNREQLMRDAKIVVDDATITSHIKRIRAKFTALDARFDRIDTVYGLGYRWRA